jgi:anti-sigma factor (TIGR02949 family)
MTEDPNCAETPHAIDCREVLDRLYEFIDGELTEVRADEVREHLAGCTPCLKVKEFEAAYVRFLEARTRARCAPEGLRKRILEQILFDPGEPESS